MTGKTSLTRVDPNLDEHFGRASLYLDDLREIERIVGGPEQKIEWHVEPFRATSVEDLIGIGPGPWSDASLQVGELLDSWYLRFYERGVEASSFRPVSDAVRGMSSRVGDIVRSRRGWRDRVADSAWAFVLLNLALTVAVLVSITAVTLSLEVVFPQAIQWTILVAIPVLMVILTIRYEKKTRLYLVPRHEAPPGFWVRNRDRLLVEVIIGLVLLGVGYVLGSRP